MAGREPSWLLVGKCCQEALKTDPRSVRAGRLLAGILLGAGRAREAHTRLQELARALPNDAAIAEQLALATLMADGGDQALPLYLALPAASQSAFETQRGFVDAAASALTLSAADAGTPASGVSAMRFSNDGTTWGAWEGYAGSKSWSLALGDGTKTVHVEYRDTAGNVSTGSITSAISRALKLPVTPLRPYSAISTSSSSPVAFSACWSLVI